MKTNLLYYGDNLQVLRTRIENESVDLVYIDPPFNSARNYFVIFKDRTGEASQAQAAAFTDTWTWGPESDLAYRELVTRQPNNDLRVCVVALQTMLHKSPMMAYLVAMALRFVEVHRVLKPTGSFYLHCDPTASHYLKILCDTIFEPVNFRNEISWRRSDAHNDAKYQYGCISDRILFYAKSKITLFVPSYTAFPDKTLRMWYQHLELSDGTYRVMTKEENETQTIPQGSRRFNRDNMSSPHPRPNLTYEYKGWKPPQNGWRHTIEVMRDLDEKGLIFYPANPEGRLMRKRFLDEQPGVIVGDMWGDISQIRSGDEEQLGYPTQKPLALLRRIIEVSSRPGDVVLDAFCGCGTTVHAAHELGRQWIGIDITPIAVSVIKTRMEQTFDGLKVPVEGFPVDLEGARTLFEADPYNFQAWACALIGSYPRLKKGADSGIDGDLPFFDYREKAQRGIVQVKGGKVGVGQIRDLAGTLTREKAAIGFFVCLESPTKPMTQEAATAGHWDAGFERFYPRIQILTVEDLLAERSYPRIPPQEKRSLLGFKASKSERPGQQKAARISKVNGQPELHLE